MIKIKCALWILYHVKVKERSHVTAQRYPISHACLLTSITATPVPSLAALAALTARSNDFRAARLPDCCRAISKAFFFLHTTVSAALACYLRDLGRSWMSRPYLVTFFQPMLEEHSISRHNMSSFGLAEMKAFSCNGRLIWQDGRISMIRYAQAHLM